MRTEVRRGRKFVEYIDDSLPVGTFVQEISGADVSYQETDGSWNPVDESWETDGLDGFSFRAHRMNHKVRFDSIGAWRWYPRRNVETEYIVINRPQCWLTATKRWGYLLVNGISREGRDITLTSVRKVTRVIHSRWNGIKTDWILLDSTAPTKFRQQIDLVGLTELDGWLYGADGEKVALLTPTTAIGADGAELPCSGSYADGYLQFEADVTGAVYPVTVDPDFAGGTADGTIVSASNADWETAQATSASFINSTMMDIRTGFTTAYVLYRGYLTFDTSSIADTDTITQVNLKLTTKNKSFTCTTPTSFDVIIKKQDWSDLDLTDATDRETAWDGCLAGTQDAVFANTGDLTANAQSTSPNLATDYVNKTGYTTYSLISGTDQTDGTIVGGAGTRNAYVTFYSANNATEANRPVLVVTSTAGSQNLTLSCAAGSYSLTGTAATLTYTGSAQNLTLSCEAGSYSLTGTNADLTVTRHYTLSCDGGSYTITGTNADITSSRTLICEPASGGAYPDIIVSGAGTSWINGTYELDGTFTTKPRWAKPTPEAPRGYCYIVWTVKYSNWLIGAGGKTGDNDAVTLLTLTHYRADEDVATPDLVTTWVVNAGVGAAPVPTVAAGASLGYILTGSDVTLTYKPAAQNLTLSCGAGSYTQTGAAATLTVQRNYTLACAAGSYALTGTNATFTVTRNYTMACNAGSYTLTGTDISFGNTKSYGLACGAGSYALTGSNVTFIALRNYSIVCGAGSYAITGTACTLTTVHNYSLACGTGIYAITGTNAALTSARTLGCVPGSYILTGLEADLFKGLVMPCGNGSYILTGSPATINSARTFALGVGSYVLVGTDAGLFIISPTPSCRTFVVYVSKCPIGHRTSTIRIVSFDNSRESIAVPAPQG